MGYILETSRINKINKFYIESEMKILDQRIQSDAWEIVNFSCDSLVEENINFGDNIFKDSLLIKRYEDANRISSEIILQHKKYDLLRTLFWINSMRIKEKCNSDYHIIVYIYKYNKPSIEQISKQRFFSKLLSELKEKYGNEIMLIPIAGDNDITTLNLLMEKYEIMQLPTILIDERIKVTEVNSMEDIEKYLD